MPMLRVCAHPDCSTRTLGEYCIEHEQPRDAAADVVDELQAVAARSASPSATYAEAETER